MPELQKAEVIASLNTRLADTERTLAELENQKHKTTLQLRTEKSLIEKLETISHYSELFKENLDTARQDPLYRRGVLEDLDIRITIVLKDNQPYAVMNILGIVQAISLNDS